MQEVVTSPVQRHLRIVNEKFPKLLEKKKDSVHTIEVKLLYIMKRARSDLEMSVVYLCTQVTKSDTDDWKKLRRVIA